MFRILTLILALGLGACSVTITRGPDPERELLEAVTAACAYEPRMYAVTTCRDMRERVMSLWVAEAPQRAAILQDLDRLIETRSGEGPGGMYSRLVMAAAAVRFDVR